MTVPVTRITFERKAITMDRIVRRRVASLHDVVHDFIEDVLMGII